MSSLNILICIFKVTPCFIMIQELCNVYPQAYTLVSLHTHTHTHGGKERWKWARTETSQPCDLITIQKQRWEDERCRVPSAAHPQLQQMMCMSGRVVGGRWAAASPDTPSSTATATQHIRTSSWEIGGLCFLSGCPQPQTPGGLCLRGNPVSLLQRCPHFSAHEKEKHDLRKTLVLILCYRFPYFLCYLFPPPTSPFSSFLFSSSSLSSAPGGR